MSILGNVSEYMNTSRAVTSEDSACIASISNTLERGVIDSRNDLENQLLYLSKRAAGKFHTDFSSHSQMVNADQPNNVLAKTWRVAIQKLSLIDPVFAAQVSYKAVLTTSSGCKAGYYARKALFENVERWFNSKQEESLTALHDTVLRSIGMNNSVSELLIDGSKTFTKLCNTKVKRNIHIKSEQLLNLYAQVSLHCSEDTKEYRDVKFDLSNKLLDCTELLHEKNSAKTQQILKSLETFYFNSKLSPEKKARYARSIASYSDIQDNSSFKDNYSKIKSLTGKGHEQYHILWTYLNRKLDFIKQDKSTSPEQTLEFVKGYLLPYIQNDEELFQGAREVLGNAIITLSEKEPKSTISHLMHIADRVSNRSQAFQNSLEKIYSLSQILAESDPIISYESLAYIARKAQPYSSIQVDALRDIYHSVIDNIAAIDKEKAMSVASDYVLLAHDIGNKRVQSIEPFFKISRPVNDKSLRQSLPVVKNFVTYAQDNPHIDDQLVKKFSDLVNVTSDEDISKALSVMGDNVQPEGKLSPLCQRALNKYFKLIDHIGNIQDKVDPLIQMSLKSGRSYEIQRPINKALIDLISTTAKNSKVEAINLCTHTLNTLEKKDARYSNLYYSVRDSLPPILSSLADEDALKASELVKKVKKSRAFHSSYYLEPLWKIEEKCKHSFAVDKLSRRLDVSHDRINGFNFSTRQLKRAYNRYSLFDSASKAIHDNQTKIGVWGFVIGALAGISYIEQGNGSGWIPILSGMGSVILATVGTALSGKAMEQSNIQFKTKIKSYGQDAGINNQVALNDNKEHPRSSQTINTSMKPQEFIKKHKI